MICYHRTVLLLLLCLVPLATLPSAGRAGEFDSHRDRSGRPDRTTRLGRFVLRDREEEEEPLLVRYNRVEGAFLGLRLPKEYWYNRYSDMAIYGHAGYGFKNRQWRYQIGLERAFLPSPRWTIGIEAHNLTDTQDEWIMPTSENSLAAFFFKEDFHDYYRREGFSAYASLEFLEGLTLSGEFRRDDYSNMRKETNWSLFGGKKRFRSNPLIHEGHLRSWGLSLAYDTRDWKRNPGRGWYIQTGGELAGRRLGGDFDFDRVIIDVRRYQPITFYENIDFRLRAGSTRGRLPEQFLFDLGGVSTLQGYPFKFLTGDRMVLANVEYRFSGRRMDFPILEDFELILFADAGWAWFAKDASRVTKSFDELSWSKLKTDVGVALADEDGEFRINFSKRTDVGGKPIVVTLRLHRPF